MREEGSRHLERTLTLPGAVTLNLLDMIGVGPFLTLPLLVGAMGGPQAMLGWLFGAVLAVCDGLVWAELGAAMPEAGGTYAYLRGIFPGRTGRWLSFLFVFQLLVSAPLSVASGCLGLAQYTLALWPQRWMGLGLLAHGGAVHGAFVFGPAAWIGMLAVAVAVLLLSRDLLHVERLGRGLLVLVLGTIGWTVAVALLHGHWAQLTAVPPGAFRLNGAFFAGLGSAMLVATYDFWGYYNVTFLGAEVRDPARTVPRALLLSIGVVTVLYLLLNASVLTVLGTPALLQLAGSGGHGAMLPQYMRTAFAASPAMGGWAARTASVLVMITAFSSVFALLLGYSRIPFAAARDGNFFAVFGRLHGRKRFPFVSLLALGGMACVFCCFSLREVIAALVALRIVLQFGLQQVGVMMWHRREPHAKRPFRMWLYPLPPLLALAGFSFVLLSRPQFEWQLVFSAVVVVLGSVAFLAWERLHPEPLAIRSATETP